MEFFLDVDGVILDFETAFIDFVRDEYLPDLPADYVPKSWEMATEFKNLDIVEVWGRFVASDRFARLDLLIDAESFNCLSEKHPVYLVTNLPESQYDNRKNNLDFHRLVYKDLFMAGHFNFGDESYPTKSSTIAKLHHNGEQIVFLDDHPKNCLDVKSVFGESSVFLMSRPHNKGIENNDWVRVEDWEEFLKKAL
ncbi:MAG: hypothetical protein HOB38_26660 [Deltaproteobacteria bacterium]|nr:hypothetical protein [Deltaproteobacteria bacterium]